VSVKTFEARVSLPLQFLWVYEFIMLETVVVLYPDGLP